MVTNRADINGLLAQMQQLKSQAMSNPNISPRSDIEAAVKLGGDISGPRVSTSATAPNFNEMFSNAINAVNDTQKAAGTLQTAYQQGEAGVSLSQVMVASQKASTSFQALTQVRNKLVEAYKDVMNMPI